MNRDLPHVHSVIDPSACRDTLLSSRCKKLPCKNIAETSLQSSPRSTNACTLTPSSVRWSSFAKAIWRTKTRMLRLTRTSVSKRELDASGVSEKSLVVVAGTSLRLTTSSMEEKEAEALGGESVGVR